MNNENIREQFQKAYKNDREKYIEGWLVTWALQDDRVIDEHPLNLPSDFHTYHGVTDFTKWFNWYVNYMETIKLDWFPDDMILPLIKTSKEHDLNLIKKFSLNFDISKYDESVGRHNAQDYLFQNLYPVPERMKINRILDFGAGYGRQANLWTQLRSDIVYVGIDGLELPYCLQHLYYQSLGLPLHDYVIEKESFEIKDQSGIYHLPTWRRDLLPKSFFDLVTCTWVLPEISERLAKEMVDVFYDVLKPGSALYIRDHDWPYRPVHQNDLNEYLEENGFVLEFRPHIIDKEDLHGTPRIWRKIDPRTRREL